MDIFSSIKLSATGADQAVKEVNKVKKSLEDAAKAGKQIGGKVEVGTSDKAQGGMGLAGEVRDFFDKKERDNAERRKDAEDRQEQTRTKGRPGQIVESGARAGAGFTDPISGDRADALRSWSNASSRSGEWLKERGQEAQDRAVKRAEEQAREKEAPKPEGDSTDTSKNVGENARSLAPLGFGVAGALLAAGGVVMNVVSSLAHKEIERASMMWSSGISQRLSGLGEGEDPYMKLRATYLEQGDKGVPYASIMSFFSSLGQAGGGYGNGLDVQKALSTATEYGIDPGTMSRTIGLRQQGGLKGMTDYMLGTEAIPQGMMTRYMAMIGNAVEDGMRRGMTGGKLEAYSEGTANLMNAMVSPSGGGLTYTGAEALTQGINAHYSGGSQIGDPKQAILFMQMRQKGESYLDTMSRVRNPALALKAQLKWARTASGGNQELLENNLAGMFGEMAPDLVQGLARGSYLVGGETPDRKRLWKGSLSKSEGQGVISAAQTPILADQEKAAVGLLGKVNDNTRKLVDLFEESAQHLGDMAAYFKGAKATKTPTAKRTEK